MVRSSILHADQVVPGGHGRVLHPVALRDLLALHFDFGRPLDGYSQGPGTGLSVVDDELGLGTYSVPAQPRLFISLHGHTEPRGRAYPTCRAPFQSGSVHRDQTRLSSLSWLPDPNLEGASWNVGAIEFDVDGVETVLPGNEPDGVLI